MWWCVGVSDHYATDDWHALSITRNIIASLNIPPHEHNTLQVRQSTHHITTSSLALIGANNSDVCGVHMVKLGVESPLWDVSELGGVIPVDTKKPFDVRAVIARYATTSHTTHIDTERESIAKCVFCVLF